MKRKKKNIVRNKYNKNITDLSPENILNKLNLESYLFYKVSLTPNQKEIAMFESLMKMNLKIFIIVSCIDLLEEYSFKKEYPTYM